MHPTKTHCCSKSPVSCTTALALSTRRSRWSGETWPIIPAERDVETTRLDLVGRRRCSSHRAVPHSRLANGRIEFSNRPIVMEDASTHYLGKPMIRTHLVFLLLLALPFAAQARQYSTR